MAGKNRSETKAMAGDRESLAEGPSERSPGETGPELLQWLLDSETEVRIYVYLCGAPGRTSSEIAESTGLYPSTVRETLASLHGEGLITRRKRPCEGRGNNPFEYSAIPPAELVEISVSGIQARLNAIYHLDQILEDGWNQNVTGPVTIEIHQESG